MARSQDDDLLIGDELAAAVLEGDDSLAPAAPTHQPMNHTQANPMPAQNQQSQPSPWGEEPAQSEEDYTGQLAVDVYETETQLVVKARTAGVNREELDVKINDGLLTIVGTLSSGDDTVATKWHNQECYWGEFSRTLELPVTVREDETTAVLKDGVLTITFEKVKQEQAKKIPIL